MKKLLVLVLLLVPHIGHASMEQAIEDVRTGNYQSAYETFMRLSSHGVPDADYWIATLYLKGLGVEKDVALAQKWLHRAARQDHVGAMAVLGRIHFEGLTGKQNFALARGWFDKAAKGGDVYAMMQLGEMYMSAIGVPMNKKIGMRYIKQAARKGSVEGQHISGMAYLKGVGVKKDLRQARFWLEKAAAQNFLASMEALRSIEGDVNQPLTTGR